MQKQLTEIYDKRTDCEDRLLVLIWNQISSWHKTQIMLYKIKRNLTYTVLQKMPQCQPEKSKKSSGITITNSPPPFPDLTSINIAHTHTPDKRNKLINIKEISSRRSAIKTSSRLH